jgi:hypothetical protein
MPNEVNYVVLACYLAAVLYLNVAVRPLEGRLGDGPLNRAQQEFRWRLRLFGYGGVALWALGVAALARAAWPIGVAQGAIIFGAAVAIAFAPLHAWYLRRMMALADRP